MIAEALDKVADLARGASGIETVVSKELRTVFIRQGEEHDDRPLPSRLRAGALVGVDDVVAAALDGKFSKEPELYHARDAIRLLVDRNDRHELVVMPLTMSQRFQKLAQMGNVLGPAALINLLRFELPCAAGAALIPKLRRVDFKRAAEEGSTTEHGRETFGAAVEAAVQQREDIPEEIDIEVPVYINPGLATATTVKVRCGVYIDVVNKGFVVKPLADAMDLAVHEAQVVIGGLLRKATAGEGEGVPVFYGTPVDAPSGSGSTRG